MSRVSSLSLQILLGIGVSNPSVVSMLEQQKGKDSGGLLPDVRLFFNSPSQLQDKSTLKGWAPWVSFKLALRNNW